MKGLYLSTRTMAILAGIAGVLFTAEVNVFAQRSPSSIQRRVDQLNRQGEQFERDKLGRDVSRDPARNDRRRAQSLMEIKKDLEALQRGYNQIVTAMAANKSADDAEILNAVHDIKECSVRLKHNLVLPQPKDEKGKAANETLDGPPDEASLRNLRKHIYDFVMNPLFESPAVLDVEQAKNASRDLDKVIEISEAISNQARKSPR